MHACVRNKVLFLLLTIMARPTARGTRGQDPLHSLKFIMTLSASDAPVNAYHRQSSHQRQLRPEDLRLWPGQNNVSSHLLDMDPLTLWCKIGILKQIHVTGSKLMMLHDVLGTSKHIETPCTCTGIEQALYNMLTPAVQGSGPSQLSWSCQLLAAAVVCAKYPEHHVSLAEKNLDTCLCQCHMIMIDISFISPLERPSMVACR